MRKLRFFYFFTFLIFLSFLTVDNGFGMKEKTKTKIGAAGTKIKEVPGKIKGFPGAVAERMRALKERLRPKKEGTPEEPLLRPIAKKEEAPPKEEPEKKKTPPTLPPKPAYLRAPVEPEAKESVVKTRAMTRAGRRAADLGEEADDIEKRIHVLEAQEKFNTAKANLDSGVKLEYGAMALRDLKKEYAAADKELKSVREKTGINEEIVGDPKKLRTQLTELRQKEAEQLVKSVGAGKEMAAHGKLVSGFVAKDAEVAELITKQACVEAELATLNREKKERDSKLEKASGELAELAKGTDEYNAKKAEFDALNKEADEAFARRVELEEENKGINDDLIAAQKAQEDAESKIKDDEKTLGASLREKGLKEDQAKKVINVVGKATTRKSRMANIRKWIDDHKKGLLIGGGLVVGAVALAGIATAIAVAATARAGETPPPIEVPEDAVMTVEEAGIPEEEYVAPEPEYDYMDFFEEFEEGLEPEEEGLEVAEEGLAVEEGLEEAEEEDV